jgi:hypothetical protein
MNLISKLSDAELLAKTKSLVREEKRITQEVLDHLEEVEYRKLHLSIGYSSLYSYCIGELGYSGSSADRRISAMRVIKNIPEAKEKLENGSVNLSTLTQLHGFLKRDSREKTYSKEMKLDLLEKIENKSQDQCVREFLRISPLDISIKESKRAVTEDLTQHTFVATKELSAKLDQLRNLMAHRNSNPTMAELIEFAVDLSIKKLNPVKHKITTAAVATCDKNSKAVDGGNADDHSGDAKVKVSSATRYISAAMERHIWVRDEGCCQFFDILTGRKCGSTFALQIDHIHPFSLGGTNDKENLRLLCRAHNNWRTRELFKH